MKSTATKVYELQFHLAHTPPTPSNAITRCELLYALYVLTDNRDYLKQELIERAKV